MLEALKQHITSLNLFSPDDKILLAVSGGIDSMVMLHLFRQMNNSIGVAHCNFQLRGHESDEDEQFVRTSVEMLGIPFYCVKFETALYAEENHLSIQMAARELRYTWFENLRKKHDYSYIATAHNADDSIETFFINLSRGCGIDGLTGIKPKSGKIIRPLLFAPRERILQYLKRKGVLYREDSSNSTDKYLRNFIRHNLLPVLDEASSNFRKGIQTTIQNLISSQTLYSYCLDRIKDEIVTHSSNTVYIDIPGLKKFEQTATVLWEILSNYQFNRESCLEIAGSMDAQPGKVFLSSTHRLIKDREKLIITPLPKNENAIFYIDQDSIPAGMPFRMEIQVEDVNGSLLIDRNPDVAILDYAMLEWPLILRKWKPGDYFAPLGMENLKKVSDFLIDLKLSIPEKEDIWVLESANRIVWVTGKRIDHRFRFKDFTRKIARIKILKDLS
jgi:tRNA(Ile)-lysidine synthase